MGLSRLLSMCTTPVPGRSTQKLTLQRQPCGQNNRDHKRFFKINQALIWFLENGHASVLWGRDVPEDLANYVVLDCCNYRGPGYRKRLHIAHSEILQWNPRPLCDLKTCGQCIDSKHILTAQHGPGKRNGSRTDSRLDKYSLASLHGLPREVTEEILAACRGHTCGSI